MAIYDADALPLLIDTMAAAGRHDAASCRDLLVAAEEKLGFGFHKSREDIRAALHAVEKAEWGDAWMYAWSATTGLTWAFPPDVSTCPPCPGDEPFDGQTRTCAGCGEGLPAHAKFCSACGQALV